MTEKELLVLMALVVTSAVVLATSEVGDARRDSRSTSVDDGDQEPSTSSRRRHGIARRPVAVVDGGYWTVRRQREATGVVSNGNSTTGSRLTAEQWRRRERNKQTRLFMIQRQIMYSLGLTRRPNVPRRRDRNVTDADIERLLPLLHQGDDSLNDSDATSARLYVVKRVHALLPTCELQRQQRPHQLCSTGLISASQSEQSLDADGTINDDISRSQMARSGQRSRSSSRPMRLYFNTTELTDGVRRNLVQVKSAVLRLHWSGNISSHRGSRDRRRDVTGRQETESVLARRRRPSGNGPASRTWNTTSASAVRLLVYQPTTDATGLDSRHGGRRLVKSIRLRASNEPRWVNIDVKSAVEQWIRKPRRNFGLQVVVRDARSRGRRRKHDALDVLDGYDCCDDVEENSLDDGTGHVTDRKNTSRVATATSPTLDVIVLQQSRRRRQGVVAGNRRRLRRRRRPGRRSRDRRDVTGSRACAMGTMHVSFAELGWDFILQPTQFVTGYCHGCCPMPNDRASHDEQNSDNVRHKRSYGVGCLPSELRPLPVILVNEQNELSLVVMPDMIVTRCDCLL